MSCFPVREIRAGERGFLSPRYGGVTKKPTEINYAMISVWFPDEASVLLW
jgi:hypothetical protein